ncbi:MAG: SDR family oxidoreductase [Candidatus Omnitrophica bacterium]|nr:SDR family oxidoreductase [Candidatus Omnitrophota bacterium]
MNSTVVITGATSGLGLSLSKLLLKAGCVVIGISRTKTHWKEAIRETNQNKSFYLYEADVSQERQVERLARTISKKFKRIDILINGAGYGGILQRLEQISPFEFRKHLDQNLVSVFLMCRRFIPKMKKDGSMIINISSMAGKRAVPFLAAYSASKFGVLALSQAIAKENSATGLKCITVCPGGMNTRMRAKLFGEEDARRQQSVSFVANVIEQVISEKIDVESGGDIIIRHGKITAINPSPKA